MVFPKVECAIRIDNIIIINPNNSEDTTHPTIHVNGTAARMYPLSRLSKGDSLQISLTIPASAYASVTTLSLHIMGDCIGYGKAVTLP